MVGLIVFGGVEPETGLRLEESVFDKGFSREACRRAWAKVGVAPLSRACLKHKKVYRSMGDGKESDKAVMRAIQEANRLAVFTLNENGWDGSPFEGEILE
jgi:hypothetical protein